MISWFICETLQLYQYLPTYPYFYHRYDYDQYFHHQETYDAEDPLAYTLPSVIRYQRFEQTLSSVRNQIEIIDSMVRYSHIPHESELCYDLDTMYDLIEVVQRRYRESLSCISLAMLTARHSYAYSRVQVDLAQTQPIAVDLDVQKIDQHKIAQQFLFDTAGIAARLGRCVVDTSKSSTALRDRFEEYRARSDEVEEIVRTEITSRSGNASYFTQFRYFIKDLREPTKDAATDKHVNRLKIILESHPFLKRAEFLIVNYVEGAAEWYRSACEQLRQSIEQQQDSLDEMNRPKQRLITHDLSMVIRNQFSALLRMEQGLIKSQDLEI